MIKKGLLILSLVLSNIAQGQTAYTTLGSDHILRINSNGILGVDIDNLELASFSAGTSNAFLRQAGLWITAKDDQGNFHTAVQRLASKDSFDFWPGPIDTLTGQTGDINAWDKVYPISKEDIANHLAHFRDDGYIASDKITNWPAEGNSGFSKYLAPFIDYNLDGTYNPMDGDYPAIKGDDAVYCIFNDINDEHTASFGASLGIEVQMLAYTYAESSSIYLEYYIINRRPRTYNDIKVGFFLDGECGLRTDNFAGTLEQYPQTIFVHNGDAMDEGFFGNELPYVGVVFLNENLSKSISFTEGNGKNGRPEVNADFIRFSQGVWKDSTPLTFGSAGTNPGEETPFIFAQSSSNSNEIWTEMNEGNTPGSRTILGITQESELLPKGYIKRNFAIISGTVKSTESFATAIKEKASTASKMWKENNTTPIPLETNLHDVYPNPSSGSFTVTNLTKNSEIYITNNQGIIAFSNKNFISPAYRCNISLPLGVYYITIITNKRTSHKPLLITH